MIFLAAILAQPVVPPQPMVVALQAPTIPPVTAPVPPAIGVRPVAVIPLRVQVSAGALQLFSGTLRVTRNSSANFQQSRVEAADVVCSTIDYYGSQQRSSLTISVSLRTESPAAPLVNVSVSWQRPIATATCPGEGMREVQLSQTVPLATGQTVTIHGDAGLVVTLGR